jgi:hypothetical protein
MNMDRAEIAVPGASGEVDYSPIVGKMVLGNEKG